MKSPDPASQDQDFVYSLKSAIGTLFYCLAEGMGLEDEKERTNVVISKEEITPSTFVPKNCTVDIRNPTQFFFAH